MALQIDRDSRGNTASAHSNSLRWTLVAICVGLIIYGTMFPFTGWRVPEHSPWPFLEGMRHGISLSDIVANILLYMPFGFLFALGRRTRVMPLVLLAALLLSLGTETVQTFLPGRVSSLLDTATNVFGAFLGAFAALLLGLPSALYKHRLALQLRSDRVAWVGIAALAFWACAQLIPFAPSLDLGNVKAGLKPLWHALQGMREIDCWRAAVYAAATAALTVAGASALRLPRWGVMAAAAVLLVIMALKVLVVGRQLSPEAFAGTLAGVLCGLLLWASDRRCAQIAAAILIAGYVVAEALHPGAGHATAHAFNWIPLRSHLLQPVNGMANLADAAWPLLALACICLRLGLHSLWKLLPIIALLLFGIEWAQHWAPGRYPDITDVLTGVVVWSCAAAYTSRSRAG